MYMPKLARFTARDPLAQNGVVLLGAIPTSLQPYVYAGNSPLNRVDPSGRFPQFLNDLSNNIETIAQNTGSFFDDILTLLPRIAGFGREELDCPKTCKPLFSNKCTFSYLLRHGFSVPGRQGAIWDIALSLSMTPGVIPPLVRGNPKGDNPITADQQKACCQSDLDRTVNAAGHITVKTLDGRVCKFTSDEFPPGGFGVDPNRVRQNLGAQCLGVLQAERLPIKRFQDPQTVALLGVVYRISTPVRSIDIDFTIKTFCGCGGYNPDGTLKDANQGNLKVQVKIP